MMIMKDTAFHSLPPLKQHAVHSSKWINKWEISHKKEIKTYEGIQIIF